MKILKIIFSILLVFGSLNVHAGMIDAGGTIEDSLTIQEKVQKHIAVAKKTVLDLWAKAKVLEKSLPSFMSDKSSVNKEIAELKESLATKEMFTVTEEAVAPDPKLSRFKKSGVPYLSVRKINVKSIPLLNVGLESKISRQKLLSGGVKVLSPNYGRPDALKAPPSLYKSEVRKWNSRNKKLRVTKGAKKLLRRDFGLGQVVTHARLAQMLKDLKLEKEIKEIFPVKLLSADEHKMLTALILYKNGGYCHVVSGLFDELAKKPKYEEEANFHLGVCAHKMGFYSESTSRLSRVIKSEDIDYTPEAIELLVSDLPKEYEIKVANILLGLKNKNIIPKSAHNNMNYILSKALARQNKFKQALNYSDKVTAKSKLYGKAQFISSVSKYSLGQVKQAIVGLEKTRKWLKKKGLVDSELGSLVSINLGRMNFQANKFKNSHIEYMKVKKDTSLWVQALVEQGWAQLMMTDPAGAIGNMYSLHSPFFKAVYKPESFAVRTIGYLNICQFGDAYQTLKMMEGHYGAILSKLNEYIKKNKNKRNYYKTIAKYLKGNSDSDVDGLPYQVIREIGRRKDFLNNQGSVNQKIDETAQYKYIDALIRKDKSKIRWKRKQAKNRMVKAKKMIIKSRKDASLLTKVNGWKAQINREAQSISSYNYKLKVFEQGRKSFRALKRRAMKRLAEERWRLRGEAGRALARGIVYMEKNLSQLIENNELLRYEVFAGSGENIRYQVAGGKRKSAQRVPASIKPQKALQWSFTGEYWEDEIGNYRSSLTDNCPKYGRRTYSSKKEHEGFKGGK